MSVKNSPEPTQSCDCGPRERHNCGRLLSPQAAVRPTPSGRPPFLKTFKRGDCPSAGGQPGQLAFAWQISIEDRFERWLAGQDGQRVYKIVVQMARGAIHSGGPRPGMKAMFEKIRWDGRFAAREGPLGSSKGPLAPDAMGYTLDNSYTALLARRIMDENPDLRGYFELRERQREKP